ASSGAETLTRRRCVVQLVSAPSATKALRFAPKKPRAKAAAARIAPNDFPPARVPTIDLTRTLGGVYSAHSSRGLAGSSSAGSATPSSPAGVPRLISRTSLGIFKGLTNVSGSSGEGSALDSSLVIVINRPILSSRQWPWQCGSASPSPSPWASAAAAAADAGRAGGEGSAGGSLGAASLAWAAAAERSRIWSRPPSIDTTAKSGE